MNTPLTIDAVSSKLRSIRNAKSLSLTDVENMSQGALKAVVLGSYERGARTLSVKRAIEIAELYQIPVSQLFNDEEPIQLVGVERLVVDLRAINKRALDEEHPESRRYQLLARIIQKIVRSRQDWNGEVLSLRHNDLETIALLFDQQISEVRDWLDRERLLLKVRTS